MISNPDGKGDDCQRRIGKTGGRKDRTAGDEQIVQPMHAAIRVHYAAGWIPGHARRPDMVAADPELVADALAETPHFGLDGRHTRTLKIPLDELETFGDAFDVQVRTAPIHTQAVDSQGILLSVQRYPAIRVGRLFGVKMQAIDVVPVE